MITRKSLVAVAFLALFCGKRGDPKPPVPIIPAAATDLVVAQRADKVILSWSYPSLTTTGKSLTDIRRISVYRHVEELPVPAAGRDPNTLLPGDVDPTVPQPIALFSKIPTVPKAQFEKLSTRIDSIEKANLTAATAGAKLIYEDNPTFRTTDGRPVRLTYAIVTEGGNAKSEPSNLATIVPLPVAVPPAPVTVTAKAEGVTVAWTAPERAVSGDKAPIVAGYNIYRNAPGQELDELATPINPALVTSTTYDDVPPYGEHEYRVAAVATTGPPLVQSAPSAPAKAAFRDLVPPPAPTGLTTLVETDRVRLVWEDVNVPDLDGYRIYRYEGSARLTLTPQLIRGTNFLDIAIAPGLVFQYEITAVDKSGNESKGTKSDLVTVPKTP